VNTGGHAANSQAASTPAGHEPHVRHTTAASTPQAADMHTAENRFIAHAAYVCGHNMSQSPPRIA
jgi:hypothetical protein